MSHSNNIPDREPAFSNSRTPLSHNFDAWRVFRIISEFVEGFETMVSIGPSVAIFGSAVTKGNDPNYKLCSELSGKLSKKGFSIITGGGPGIMEAANHGSKLAGGNSCGLCVDLPTEEEPNPYIDRKYLLKFRYFFVRKVMFVRHAQAFVVFPGGYGTLDEVFEPLTLIKTKKIKPFPIYLIGKEYWSGLMDWLKQTVLKQNNITIEDLDLIRITDDIEEVVNGIETHFIRNKCLENF